MNWFYSDRGQQNGPVSDMVLTTMVREGRLHPNTMVWSEGMADWQPLAVIRPDLVAGPGAPTLGGVVIPEQNKDALIQQMREGALPAGFGSPGMVAGLRYAGFWIRFAAKFIDSIILLVPYAVLFFVLIVVFPIDSSTSNFVTNPNMDLNQVLLGVVQQLLLTALTYSVYVAYNTLMVAKWGATLGKMAVGVKVVRADGQPLTMKRSLGRAVADLINSFACNLPYLTVAFDEEEKRGVHDHICGTRVVMK